jgi:peptidoglycan/LPS O-acetylase OafA/YrhL
MDPRNTAVYIVLGLALIIAWVIISWYNYRLKNRIIEAGTIDEEALGFIKKMSGFNGDALKWGCVIFAAGLGLVVINYVPFEYGAPLPYGLEAMFIAAGFLVYYTIMQRKQHP